MPPLEELYRRLLVAYPAGYRREHESEILTTLVDAAEPGRRLPSPREAGGLLAGGLRTRGMIAAREGWRTLLGDALRIAAVLLLASRLVETQMLYLDAQGPRVRLVPVLLALGIVAAVRGAGRLSLGLLVLGGVAASVYWHEPAPETVPSLHRLAADISWYLSPVHSPAGFVHGVPVILAMALLLCQVSLRTARRPWSWWLAAALIASPVLLQFSFRQGLWTDPDSILHLPFVATLGMPWLTLPGVLLVCLSLIAADPRPALGAALYGACSLLVALSYHVAYGSFLVDRVWQSELVVPAVISMAGAAAAARTVVRRHRLARL